MTSVFPRVIFGAIAVTSSSLVFSVEPANYSIGQVLVTPKLNTQVGYTDNLLRLKNDEKDTWFSVVNPDVQAWIERGLTTYSLSYELADYRYFDSSDDDYTDHTVSFDVHYDFNSRNVLNAYAQYYWIHEERGTGFTEGEIATLVDEPVELERAVFGGDYTFGSESSDGRLRLAAEGVDHDYQNFDEFTRFRNRDSLRLDGTFFWRIASRTDAIAEVRYIDTEYDKSDPADVDGSLDSEEYVYYAGLSWQATAKTSGSVRLGLFDRSYDSSARDDDDGFSWEADILYLPRTYSRISLETGRYFEETNGFGDGVDTNETTLAWEHDWDARSTTRFSASYGEEDYTGSVREDELYGVEASYTYAMRRWLDLGLGYRYEERESDLNSLDYDRNEFFVEATVSL